MLWGSIIFHPKLAARIFADLRHFQRHLLWGFPMGSSWWDEDPRLRHYGRTTTPDVFFECAPGSSSPEPQNSSPWHLEGESLETQNTFQKLIGKDGISNLSPLSHHTLSTETELIPTSHKRPTGQQLSLEPGLSSFPWITQCHLVGGIPTPLQNMTNRQLGLWHSKLNGKHKIPWFQTTNQILWFSYGFPMVFLWFSYGFPMVFLWFPWFQSPPLSTSCIYHPYFDHVGPCWTHGGRFLIMVVNDHGWTNKPWLSTRKWRQNGWWSFGIVWGHDFRNTDFTMN